MNLVPDNTLIEAVEAYSLFSSGNPDYPVEGMKQIALQEGCSLSSYQDSLGNWTIGIGHTPSYPHVTWTMQQCLRQFWLDVNLQGVTPVNLQLPWTRNLGVIRWWVFVNMSFNMGIGNLLEFQELFTACQNEDWSGAVAAMKNSLWYQQVPNRVDALAHQMLTNQWVIGYLN